MLAKRWVDSSREALWIDADRHTDAHSSVKGFIHFYTHTHTEAASEPHRCLAGLNSTCLFREGSVDGLSLIPTPLGGRMTQADVCEETEAEEGKQMMDLSLRCLYCSGFVYPLDHHPICVVTHTVSGRFSQVCAGAPLSPPTSACLASLSSRVKLGVCVSVCAENGTCILYHQLSYKGSKGSSFVCWDLLFSPHKSVLKKIQIEKHKCERCVLVTLLPAVLINTLTKGTRGLFLVIKK